MNETDKQNSLIMALSAIERELMIANKLKAIEMCATLSPNQMGMDYAFLITTSHRPVSDIEAASAKTVFEILENRESTTK